MSSVCFYFQVHQPFRVKHYPFFRIQQDHRYFDEDKNAAILRKVARKCYLPTNRILLELIEKHQGRFRVAFSLTGLVLEQLMDHAPEAFDSFCELAKTGCVEFLAETYYHSLAALYDEVEFEEQVRKHQAMIEHHFGSTPKVFRNTELVYNDVIANKVAQMGYRAILTEGVDEVLGWRSPNYVYENSGANIRLLLKNYRLSDDIAFRFSNPRWSEYPLSAEKYAGWIHSLTGKSEILNLFMDYETFGEHQWESTGIFDFFKKLPGAILANPDWSFQTPSEAIERYHPVSRLSFEKTVSWADQDRDLSAWEGNHMQKSAIRQAYELGPEVRRRNNAYALDLWRKLLASDHFYYMCTKWMDDGNVHAYFSPFSSPYEAFINYMNALTDFRESVLKWKPTPETN